MTTDRCPWCYLPRLCDDPPCCTGARAQAERDAVRLLDLATPCRVFAQFERDNPPRRVTRGTVEHTVEFDTTAAYVERDGDVHVVRPWFDAPPSAEPYRVSYTHPVRSYHARIDLPMTPKSYPCTPRPVLAARCRHGVVMFFSEIGPGTRCMCNTLECGCRARRASHVTPCCGALQAGAAREERYNRRHQTREAARCLHRQ